MNRNICIINNNPHNFNNFDNIHYTKIDNIINYSVDNMVCDMLNTVKKDLVHSIMNKICTKIRLGGKLVISIQNLDTLAKEFANGLLDGEVFLSIIKNIESIVSILELQKFLNDKQQEFKVIQSNLSGSISTIVIQRVAL